MPTLKSKASDIQNRLSHNAFFTLMISSFLLNTNRSNARRINTRIKNPIQNAELTSIVFMFLCEGSGFF